VGRIIRTLAALALLKVVSGHASEARWDGADFALGASALTLLAVDWGQTRHIAKNPDRFYEKNGLLGRHPSVDRVDAYFVGSMITTVLVADLLVGPWRKAFLAGIIVMEYDVVTRNRAIGIRVGF